MRYSRGVIAPLLVVGLLIIFIFAILAVFGTNIGSNLGFLSLRKGDQASEAAQKKRELREKFKGKTFDQKMEILANERGIKFPVKQLDNCSTFTQCYEYCEISDNHGKCSKFLEKNKLPFSLASPGKGKTPEEQGFSRIEDELVVLFHNTIKQNDKAVALKRNNLIEKKGADFPELDFVMSVVKVDPKNLDKVRKKLEKDKDVKSVDMNYIGNILGGGLFGPPSGGIGDPTTPQRRTPIEWDANKHHYLELQNAPSAWSQQIGHSNGRIAIVDTGIDVDHPDLAGKLYIPIGANILDESNDVTDNQGHGTTVAGVAAAINDNISGSAVGVAWLSTIVPIKVSEYGQGETIDIAEGIIKASSSGAAVINVSFAVPETSYLETAVNNAWNAGAVIVAAQGIYPPQQDQVCSWEYPASYSNVIDVTGVDRSFVPNTGCKFGGPSITAVVDDLLNPSNDGVWTTTNNGGYGYSGLGTSLASPMVAGAALLLRECNNSQIAVRTALLEGAQWPDPNTNPDDPNNQPSAQQTLWWGENGVLDIRAAMDIACVL